MFDIANNRGKVQYQGEMLRLMARMEMVFARGLAPLLRRQFRLAAEAVASGGGDTDRAVDTVAFPLASYFVDRYKRIAAVFGEEALKRWAASELKKQDTMRTRFWQTMNVWARKEAATQVVKVNKTTKNHISRIVHKGMGEGMSNAEMAKEIRKVGQITTNTRARRIARTETHTASVHSINEATKSTGMDFEREWIAALDDRVRRGGKESPWNHVAANGERVGMEEPFKKTGEHLMYPGDPKGSAGNVINCRCVLIYHREKKIAIEKQPRTRTPSAHQWVPAKTLEEAEKNVRNHFEYVQFRSSQSKRWDNARKLKMLNMVDEEIVYMKQRFGILGDKKIGYFDFDYGDTDWNGMYGGYGRSFDRTLSLHDDARWTAHGFGEVRIAAMKGRKYDMTVGGGKIRGTLRHEIGHAVQSENYVDKEASKNWGILFRKIKEQANKDPRFKARWKSAVGDYSLTDYKEFFAELFEVYTSPKFRPGSIDKVVGEGTESLIHRIIRGSAKEPVR